MVTTHTHTHACTHAYGCESFSFNIFVLHNKRGVVCTASGRQPDFISNCNNKQNCLTSINIPNIHGRIAVVGETSPTWLGYGVASFPGFPAGDVK